ncbi:MULTISPECIES: efflux transporter outer membrane subunit [unclassified Sphingomonas]|uniref:efflux transporter outer membrane subunit n=1 Tax=unclassified Sphingomonas TaxID=196159 RepID=UPI0006FF4435|nr:MULTISPECIES: efflux transporter outer membrane subunit [unclassified Sphingomonas]KQM62234.1 RND transporter [Sphingomonas sp. Leaf16]KQN13639.1 RND transporter [Sphingomonas sp. Leaf29]KQN23130.1 RND transporter [Sphingomonas sp. Leaf32]
MTTRILPLAALLLLGACTVGPNYAGPPATASDAVQRGTFARAADSAFTPAPGLARWWEGLNDPLLAALVDDALAHSPNIDLATARVREAQAQSTQQRASQLPSVSANATVLGAELPPIQPGSGGTSVQFYNVGANASWELDLFGGGRRRNEQARATEDARIADLADVQVSLSAAVAQAYVALRDVQARIALSDATTRLQRQQLTLTRQRLAAGTASQLSVERLQTQLENTQAQAIPLAAQRDEYLNQLAVLTGRTPGALDATLAPVAPVPLPPAQVAVGDPASLIARRPDVRAAERQLAAGTAGIGVAKARELPGIRFLGLLGLGGTSPGDIFDLSNIAAIAAPSLSWSFLDFGKNRAATRVSEAQRDQADATYRRTVLEALQDAETALSRYGNSRRQLGQLVQAETTAKRATALNRQRVTAGTTTLIDQLDVERQQLSATSAVTQARAQLTQYYIAVNKALGLGWTDPVSADAGRSATAATPPASAR